MKLTAIQRTVLAHMAAFPRGEGSAYGMSLATGTHVTVSTMQSLQSNRLVVSDGDPGDMVFPTSATYIITAAGRAAIAEREGINTSDLIS